MRIKQLGLFVALIAVLWTFCACPAEDRFSHPDGAKTTVFTVTYDYGHCEEGKVTTLLDGNDLFFDAEAYGVSPLLAGDKITAFYTGEMLMEESYPGRVVIKGGELTDVSKQGAALVELEYAQDGWFYIQGENRTQVQVTAPEYVVNADGSFASVSSLEEGSVIYATEQGRLTKGDLMSFSLYALYSYYPRTTVEMKTAFPWIETLNDVRKVKKVKQTSCNPSLFTAIETSENEKDRGQVCDYLQNLFLREVPTSEWQVDGGGAVDLIVYTETDMYALTFSAGYIVINGVGYKPDRTLPAFTDGKTAYGFAGTSLASLYKQGELMEYEDLSYLLAQLAFVESDDTEGLENSGYHLQTACGKVEILDVTHFLLNGTVYELVGETTFSKIFEISPLS